jgi:hypothetical protein
MVRVPGPRRAPWSRALSGSGVGRQFAQAVRRVVDALLPPARSVVPAVPTAPPMQETDVRLRARQALAEARAHLEPLLSDGPGPAEEAIEHPLAESVLLRQSLRAYTDHVERLLAAAEEERRALRTQINRLTEEVLALRAEVAELRLRVALPARMEVPTAKPVVRLTADPGAAPTDTAEAVGEGVQPRTTVDVPRDGQIFPAGSVGIVVELRPRQQPRHLDALCARLRGNAAVDRAEPLTAGTEASRLRLAFRQPVTWEQLRDAIEQAAGAQVDATTAAVRDRVLHLRLRAPAPAGPPPTPPAPDP